MSESKFPKGWDEDRVRKLVDYYDGLSEDEIVAEDEAAMEDRDGQVIIAVPVELLPAIRQLLATHDAAQ